MEEKSSSSQVSASEGQSAAATGPSSEIAGTEARKAYGTAKTENLRDSGLWRILLPAFIIVASLLLLFIPFLLLIQLLATSLTPASATAGLAWLWTTMIVLEIVVAALIIWGFSKAFFRQLGYAH